MVGRQLELRELSGLARRCRDLLVDVAEFAVHQGDEERRAVRRGLSYWPDVDSLVVPSLAGEH